MPVARPHCAAAAARRPPSTERRRASRRRRDQRNQGCRLLRWRRRRAAPARPLPDAAARPARMASPSASSPAAISLSSPCCSVPAAADLSCRCERPPRAAADLLRYGGESAGVISCASSLRRRQAGAPGRIIAVATIRRSDEARHSHLAARSTAIEGMTRAERRAPRRASCLPKAAR